MPVTTYDLYNVSDVAPRARRWIPENGGFGWDQDLALVTRIGVVMFYNW